MRRDKDFSFFSFLSNLKRNTFYVGLNFFFFSLRNLALPNEGKISNYGVFFTIKIIPLSFSSTKQIVNIDMSQKKFK